MANVGDSPTLQASSAVRRSGMSITLPRNFAPMSLDGSMDEPRTPNQTFSEINLPPPPPHSTFRVRRPRIMMENFQARNNALPSAIFASEILPSSSPTRVRSGIPFGLSLLPSDEPVSSVEALSPAERPSLLRGSSEPLNISTLRIPAAADQIPHTPVGQTNLIMPEAKCGTWDMRRTASVCSVRSDSSTASDESYATRPTSFDGSTTSPDCDSQDPFSHHVVNVIPDTPTRQRKKMRINTSVSRDHAHWTIEMDNHLFNVYQMYLADPTVTPFKTVPGSIPPTGVCHRVARRARETWPKASRIAVPIVKRYRVRSMLDIKRNMRAKTPEPEDFLKTDDITESSNMFNSWPSESSTRRRLKQLCREKFTITAHYQRLRESRSPSPFSEQFTKRPSSRICQSASQSGDQNEAFSYTTRELGISLVANDATAPLAQLMSDDTPAVSSSPREWFNTPINTSDLPSQTTPTTSSIHLDRLALPAAKIPRLASPFNYSTWNGSRNQNLHRRHISHGQYDTVHATGARLLSPFRHDTNLGVNANKRRATHNLEDELSPSGSNLGTDPNAMNIDGATAVSDFRSGLDDKTEILFSNHGDIGQRRIRIRNRGATLGSALQTSQERIERLFNQPDKLRSEAHGIPQIPDFIGSASSRGLKSDLTNSLAVPEAEPVQRRLGSPFELDPNKRSLRNRTPRHVPSLSDPFISTDHFGLNETSGIASLGVSANDMGNIGERLALFSNIHQQDSTPNQGTN